MNDPRPREFERPRLPILRKIRGISARIDGMPLRRFRSAGASCRRIFTRFDKLDATLLSFFNLAVEMIFDLAWTGPSLIGSIHQN